MATRRTLRPAKRRSAGSPLDLIVNIATIGVILVVGWLAWPMLSSEFHARSGDTSQQTQPAPTLAPAQRLQLQQAAPETAAEQQAVNQAVPTEDVKKPPLLPIQATAAAVQQPIVTSDQAAQYSPVDLGWAPLPTPTTMLSPEQYAESQASEEQNFLNNAEQGLTEAQKLVKIHEAEQNAQRHP